MEELTKSMASLEASLPQAVCEKKLVVTGWLVVLI